MPTYVISDYFVQSNGANQSPTTAYDERTNAVGTERYLHPNVATLVTIPEPTHGAGGSGGVSASRVIGKK